MPADPNQPVKPPSSRMQRMRRFVDIMENAVRIPGTRYRIGLDALLGLVPGVGDFVTATAAFVLLWEARRLGIPFGKRAKMVGYIFFDMLIGIVPLVGDLFDVAYKSNTRILKMIEEHIAQHGDATVNPASRINVPKFLQRPHAAKPRRAD
ncbi:hypothetical protein DSM3645_10002 [Blastopirellula marina DSM 3645]|uniref:DUF4112 domain-containing protein n=2 Tax=Blastopirellula marina TaxID=124 RepID=A3ZLU1_9BACT|nr:hypothetical protein DSM3645_10002 [Blastopirellula marina DSM 3645]